MSHACAHPKARFRCIDHSWKPFTKSEYDSFLSSPVSMWSRFHLPMLFLYPYYLIKESQLYGFSGNHFNPLSPMFGPNDRIDAAISSLRCPFSLPFPLTHYGLSKKFG